MSACESVPEGLENHPAHSEHKVFFKAHDPFQHDISATMTTWEEAEPQFKPLFFSIWGKIVEQYSAAELTKDTDKLIAVFGIANALAARTKLKYTAGLWDYNVPLQLMWCTKEPVKRSSTFQAPSWLWASIKSVISWQYNRLEHTCIEILHLNQIALASTSGNFPTFERRPRIRGNLIPGTLSRADTSCEN